MFFLSRRTISISALAAAIWLSSWSHAAPLADAPDPAQETIRVQLPPAITAWRKNTIELRDAMAAYCTLPASQNPAALAKPQNAWMATMTAWRELSVLPVKPVFAASGLNLNYDVNWPSTQPYGIEGGVDMLVPAQRPQVAAGAPLDVAGRPLGRLPLPSQIRGMTSLAYLLWTPKMDPSVKQPLVEKWRHCAYAVVLAEDLTNQTFQLELRWKAYMQDSFAGKSDPGGASANEVLLGAIIDGLRQLQRRHNPQLVTVVLPGRLSPLPPAPSTVMPMNREVAPIDGALTRQSAQFYQRGVEMLSRATLGEAGKPATFGFALALQRDGHGDLVEPLRKGFGKLRADAAKLPPSLSAEKPADRELAKQLTQDVQALLDQLSGPIATALGVVVGFGDGDGG